MAGPNHARVVFIEGLPGSGKSTAAQRLAWESERQGIPARWYYESEPAHPLGGYYDPSSHAVADYLSSTVARWQAFVASASPGVHLVESHLFQGPLGSLLLHDVEVARISALVRSLMLAMEPLAPRLIRLRDPDLTTALERILRFRWGTIADSPYTTRFSASRYAQRRGLAGFPGYLSFLAECLALSDGICNDSSWPILELWLADRGASAYRERLQAMRRFISIPESSQLEPAVALSLRACIGTYALPDGTHFLVQDDAEGEAGGLLVVGHPRLWKSGNRLLYRHGLHFLVVSWPFDLRFEPDAAGTITQVGLCSVRGEPLGWLANRVR